MLKSIINNGLLFFVLIIHLLDQTLYSQLTPGGIGSFESNVHSKWKAAPENADFTNIGSDFYEQSGALKVISGGEHSLINYDSSNFNKQIGQEVSISFYLKSKKGNSISVTIKDGWGNAAEETPQIQTVRSNEWSYYSFSFIPTSASSSGKIKLIFSNSGTYIIDALTLENKSTSNLYVSASAGNGGNGSLASPFNTIQKAVNSWKKGDIIYVRSGTYFNDNHGNGTNNDHVVNLSSAYYNISTAPDIYNPLVIRNYSGETPKIKFDGSGGIIGGRSGVEASFIEISGFEIEGPNANITYNDAITNRTSFVNQVAVNPNAQPQKKFTGRGIAIWSGHHIILHNNIVYNCPNSGIRVNNGDYVVIAHNQVYNSTWWSFNAESAIVIAQSKHIDDMTYKIKMRITHNKTYDNINKIPYFNKTYMNNGTCDGVTASSSRSDKYGCDVQDYIIDGSGCYITRNNSNGSGANDQNPNGQYKGTFYFANNLSYGNGLNGLVVHKTNNAIVANNTIYENGQIPTNVNTNYGVDWKDALNHGRQGSSGITIHSSYNVKVFNNVSWAKQANDNAFQIFSINTQNNPNAVTGSNNVLAFGEVSNSEISFFPNGFYVDKRSQKESLFKNSTGFNFELPQGSYLVDNGVQNDNIPLYDISSTLRVSPDIGAYEYPVNIGKQSAAESLTGFENINKNIDDPDFNINASSNSTGSITYTSSNPNVASVSGNTISILGSGTTQITLNQAEDDNYEAFSRNITLTVTLGNNSKHSAAESLIGFENINKNLNDSQFNINASSRSSGLITYSSSNLSVATVSGNTVTVVGTGSTQITLNQAEDDNYEAFSKNITLTVTINEGNESVGNEEKYQTRTLDEIKVSKVHKNTIENMQGLIDLAIQKSGFTKDRQIFLNRYMNYSSDWNGDGLIDLFIPVGSDPEVGSFASLLIQKNNNGKISFEYDEDYSIFVKGDAAQIHRSVSDFNGDGLLDIFHHTQNYHGRDGYQPDFYFDNCPIDTHEKLFINTGNGLKEYEIDDTFQYGEFKECPLSRYNSTAFDIDRDGVDEVISSAYNTRANTTSINNKRETYIIRYYDIDDTKEGKVFSLNFAFTEEEFLKYPNSFDSNLVYEKGGKLYLPLFRQKYKHGNHIGFLYDDYWENHGYQSSYDLHQEAHQFLSLEILNFNINDQIDFSSYNTVNIFDGIDQDYVIADDWCIHVENLDEDDEYEYILLFMENYTYKQGHIRIFDHDGADITSKWIGWSSYKDFNIDLSNNHNGVMDSHNFNYDQSYNHANGIHVVDLDNDGDVDIVPQNGWYFNSTGADDMSSRDYNYFIFINNGKKFIPTKVKFQENHKNSSGFIDPSGWFKGFKIPVDLDGDGYFEIVQMRSGYQGSANDINYDVVELIYDSDKDGVINQNDANPNDPYSNSNDVNGNKIFSLPSNNFSISIENLSCRGSSDGSIAVSAKDENLNYTLTINGNDTHNLNSSSGFSKSITNLNTGQYNLCFTVEGESGYNQCFDINISEPAPLSASSRVNNANKSISFDLSGSDKYTIVHNGIEKDFDHSNPKIDLKKGVNFLKVKTDKSCQGSYTEEVFISEEVEFYPNPTKDNVNLYIHGKDSNVDVRVIDGDGNILKTSCKEIHSSRKVQVNLEEFSKGIYLIQLNGETVDKTVKIVRE